LTFLQRVGDVTLSRTGESVRKQVPDVFTRIAAATVPAVAARAGEAAKSAWYVYDCCAVLPDLTSSRNSLNGTGSLEEHRMTRYPERIVDIHTHLFNAHSLPMERILREGSLGYKAPKWLAKLVAGLVNALTGADEAPVGRHVRAVGRPNLAGALRRFASTQRGETETTLAEFGHALAGVAAAELARRHAGVYRAALAPATRRAAAAGLTRALQEDELVAALEEIEQAFVARTKGSPARLREDLAAFRSQQVRRAGATPPGLPQAQAQLAGFISERIEKALKWLVDKLYQAWGKTTGALDQIAFVFFLMLKEERMYEHLQKGYANGLKVRFNHLMMDMEPAYKETPRKTLQVQIEQMTSIMRESREKLTGFVAFHPDREDGLKVAKDALEHGGFAGVKVYPGLGYVPDANKGVWKDLLGFVCENSIPVLAHCTPAGWELHYEQTGRNSDPIAWETILGIEGYRRLRLCLGHGGGSGAHDRKDKSHYFGWADDWSNHDVPVGHTYKGNYAEMIVKLCREYENVYCDLSYHELLVVDRPGVDSAKAREQMIANLVREIGKDQSDGSKYKLREKLMYGTDFHMPTLISRTQEYLDAWVALIENVATKLDTDADQLKRLFFFENAERFLNLK
jgi:hypothetical protein